MGQHLLLTYLETDLPSPYAFSASAGWGGDRYALIEGPQGELALVAVIAWDTRDDAVEFLEAFHSHLERKSGLEWEQLDDSGSQFYRMHCRLAGNCRRSATVGMSTLSSLLTRQYPQGP